MGSKARKKQIWCAQPLTPLMEGPDPELQEEGSKKESSWEVIREWFRVQKSLPAASNFSTSSSSYHNNATTLGPNPKRRDLRLLLGVLGCPLAPIPQVNDEIHDHLLHIKDIPFVRHRFSLTLALSLIFIYQINISINLYMYTS